MRVVGGVYRGRRLASPRSDGVRPTADRAREALFNVLEHAYPDSVKGARVLDLFAGTGALGLEAISRGASYCLFVEEAVSARALIRENIMNLGLAGCTRIFRRDATRLGPIGNMAPFGLVFADPPYGRGLSERAIVSALSGGWLTEDALLMIEESADSPFNPPPGIVLEERRNYASSTIAFCRRLEP
ncbi:16S rRNA (guanine(966)-N(2))-methyltransferase RsmD [Chelativorans sp. Marseille-P2723]|uniref:16S rRNA (guanine(966)-N(2))-methyltransferase RsmD n=1 Tax=Chelativorans sp. Marseille-P2723 TaxID=2709133 RepID=UPI00156F6C23|nr:16S rRNA (guanine(966)-N(2))-methyltransferase RsmD [Chelativorans sp. Marseille-P2723]